MVLSARGNREAFATLVRRHQDGLLNFFRRMGDYNDGEDLAQETFVRLFKYRKRYRPKAKFRTFLYVLARRTWIDHRRAADTRRRAGEKLAENTEIRLSGTDPARDADTREHVAAALAGLSDEMRTVVVMSIYHGFKYREIAEIAGIPLGTVKTRMFHALRKLKEALSDENES